MPKILTLNSGAKFPQIGFGCWKVPDETCEQQIYAAIKAGYRMFDGAIDYGNEVFVGKGIRKAIDDGLVKREDLFIVSKVWNTFHSPKGVRVAINKILKDLGLDYVDLLLMHFPIAQKFVPVEEKYPPHFYCGKNGWEFEDVPISVTWSAMEELVGEGLAKSIGVSNFTGALLQDLLRGSKIRPAVLQIEHHPYLVQRKFVKWVQDQGIVVTAYSSFGPQSFVDINDARAINTPPLFEHPVITDIAKAHGVTPAQVLLRWSTQHGLVVIPKSSHKERLLQNLKSDEFDLTDEELGEIEALDHNLRFNDPWDWVDDNEKLRIPLFV